KQMQQTQQASKQARRRREHNLQARQCDSSFLLLLLSTFPLSSYSPQLLPPSCFVPCSPCSSIPSPSHFPLLRQTTALEITKTSVRPVMIYELRDSSCGQTVDKPP